MDENRDKLILEIKHILDSFSTVKSAYLFGSYATDHYNAYSDIDIAIDCDIDDYFDILDELDRLNTIRRFDVHNVNYSTFVFDTRRLENVIQLH